MLSEGTVPITINTDPANAWIVFTPDNSTSGTMNFVYAQPFAESNLYGPTYWLTPGTYYLKIELSYYDQVPEGPTLLALHAEGPKTLTINLHYNPLNGVYTPLWAFTNAEVAALSYSGNGTSGNPYMIFNNQYRDFAKYYGLYNDYTFPVYPASSSTRRRSRRSCTTRRRSPRRPARSSSRGPTSPRPTSCSTGSGA